MSSKLENGKLVIVDSVFKNQVVLLCPRLVESIDSSISFEEVCKRLVDGKDVETFIKDFDGSKISFGKIVLSRNSGATEMCNYYPNVYVCQVFYVPAVEFVKLIVDFTLSSALLEEKKEEKDKSFNLPSSQCYEKYENKGQRSEEKENSCQHLTLVNIGQIQKMCSLCLNLEFCPFKYCKICNISICQWCHQNGNKSCKRTDNIRDNISSDDKYELLLRKIKDYEQENLGLKLEVKQLMYENSYYIDTIKSIKKYLAKVLPRGRKY
jgi:hypothetical protein